MYQQTRLKSKAFAPDTVFGQAVDLDGTTGYIKILQNPISLPSLTSDFTVEGYFRLDSCAIYKTHGILSRMPGVLLRDNYHGEIGGRTGGGCSKLTFNFDDGIDYVAGQTVGSNSYITPQQWYHFAVTKNNQFLKLYLNGVLEGTRDISARPLVNGGEIVLFGASGNFYGIDNPANKLDGQLDEIRISNNVRYAQDFTPPSAPFISDSNTTALYHFDENVLDASGNGYDGTIVGGTTFIPSTIGSTITPTPTPTSSITPTPPPNNLPYIVTRVLPAGRKGYSYEMRVTGGDQDVQDTLTMTAASVPPGLSLGNCQKRDIYLHCWLSGTPTQIGSWNIRFRITDNRGGIGSKTINLKITQ